MHRAHRLTDLTIELLDRSLRGCPDLGCMGLDLVDDVLLFKLCLLTHEVLRDFGGCLETSCLASLGCLLEDLRAQSLHLLFDWLVLDGARGLGQEVLEDLVLVCRHLE